MLKKSVKTMLVFSLLTILLVIAGCGGGGSSVQRVKGLTPDGVVKTFFTAAKNNKMTEASLYVSPASKSDAQTVLKFLTGQSGIEQIKKSNLFSVKLVAQQGDYAAVIATLQEQDSLKFTVKPIGLEKINGEWYIVDFDQIYNDAKYKVLQQLLSNIKI